jgi:hypothetical protein
MNGKGPVRGPDVLSQPALQETFRGIAVAGNRSSRRKIRGRTGLIGVDASWHSLWKRLQKCDLSDIWALEGKFCGLKQL